MQVDERQLYNRQEYVIGAETQAKYGQSDVLIVGLTGLGCEIAKNLCLTGVRSITLLDDEPLKMKDLSSHFLASEADVGHRRSDVILHKVAELNRLVNVKCAHGPLSDSILKEFTVVIFVDQLTTTLIQENTWARLHGVKFVACESRGISGCLFVDGGSEPFVVNDANGEDCVSCIVTGITSEGVVTCHEDKKHECEPNSKVYFTGVESPTSLNSDPARGVFRLFDVDDVTGPFTLKLRVPGEEVGDVVAGHAAYMHTTKKQAVVHFNDLATSLRNPAFNFIIDDDSKLTAPCELHEIYQIMHCLMKKGATVSYAEACETAVRALPSADANFVRGVVETFFGNLNPMACLIGGLASQEALKLCSGKFTPLQQWLYYDVRELLSFRRPVVTPLGGSRYDGFIETLGAEAQAVVAANEAFIVGAGALGCELIKNVALLGFGGVTITDMDSIEMSNLSRQFLFRTHHISQPKSRVAAEAARLMNPSVRVTHLEEKVARETEEVFNEKFWKSKDVIINALDNMPARLYVDERCLYFKKPLFESGTLGTKCNVQVVIPSITESYGNSADPPEKSIPLCTLKNFPSSVEHTIQWARDAFQQLFFVSPSDVNSYLNNPAQFEQSLESDPGNKPNVLKAVAEVLNCFPATLGDCAVLARNRFDEFFSRNILNLLYLYPLDKKNDNGQPFWTGARKPPTAAVFDPSNDQHADFIVATTALFAEVFSVHGEINRTELLRQASEIPPFVFVPPTNSAGSEQPEPIIRLPPASLFPKRLRTIEFEKDVDANFHIDFITVTSNLRACNYGIPQADRVKTKMIAGKIIPAMVTTTSLVTGLVTFEVLKYCLGLRTLRGYFNAFVNVALPSLVFSDPIPCASRRYRRPDGSFVDWTPWDRLDVYLGRDITVKELVQHLADVHLLEIDMIATPSGKLIYSMFGKKDLNRPVSVVAEEKGESIAAREVTLVASGNFGDDVEVDIPTIRYSF